MGFIFLSFSSYFKFFMHFECILKLGMHVTYKMPVTLWGHLSWYSGSHCACCIGRRQLSQLLTLSLVGSPEHHCSQLCEGSQGELEAMVPLCYQDRKRSHTSPDNTKYSNHLMDGYLPGPVLTVDSVLWRSE